MVKRSLVVLLMAAGATLSAQAPSKKAEPTLTLQQSGTTQGLIAVSPVNPQVVWASGRGGTFVVTTDGGLTWRAGVVPGAETLQFRDVQGVSEKVAYLQSIGNNATDFRIYKTEDGGATWTMQFQNQDPAAFYDCFAFWTPKRGISHSDSVNGVFPDLRILDGTTWEDISANMPPALAGETSFASSGTCAATQGGQNAWIVTGGSSAPNARARALATRDGGDTWGAYDTPLLSTPSSGAFTVAFRNPWNGIVGGGDLDPGNPGAAATATSNDGGVTWTLTSPPPVTGAIFGLAYAHGAGGGDGDGSRTVVITANAGGAAWTPDEGATWFTLPGVTGYWAVAFASPKAGWLVGTGGRILKVSF
jgi:photosystem II stability/assembly factor-like uncharacterized protein